MINKESIVFDTSFLMDGCSISEMVDEYNIIIPIIVVKELDHLKTNIDHRKSSSAIKALWEIDKNLEKISFDFNQEICIELQNYTSELTANDDVIISCAKRNDAIIASNDLALKIKCNAIGIRCYYKNNQEGSSYCGYKYIKLSDDEFSDFYTEKNEPDNNMFDCLTNEYILLKNEDEQVVDKYRWDGKFYVPLTQRSINNMTTGKIKARNDEQELLIDLLFNRNIPVKVITGGFGTGKTLISSASALSLVENKAFDSIMYIRNNYGVKDTKDIGALPGEKNQKMMPYVSPLADQVGGEYGVEMLINQGKLELEHLGFLRGRDIANKIVLVNEAENLTKEHIQLIISRIAEGSQLWLDGDVKQVDDKIFEKNNGLSAAINRFKGNKLFGCVRLQKTERSACAELASLLDGGI